MIATPDKPGTVTQAVYRQRYNGVWEWVASYLTAQEGWMNVYANTAKLAYQLALEGAKKYRTPEHGWSEEPQG